MAHGFLIINVTLILQVCGIIFYAGKTYNHPFRGLFKGAQDFFAEGAETFLAPLMVTSDSEGPFWGTKKVEQKCLNRMLNRYIMKKTHESIKCLMYVAGRYIKNITLLHTRAIL